jgi:hypothetical protein
MGATAKMHCIISNLYSALDSLIHEISFAYSADLKRRDVNIYLDYQLPNPKNRRMRCRFLQGDQVGPNLDEELTRAK